MNELLLLACVLTAIMVPIHFYQQAGYWRGEAERHKRLRYEAENQLKRFLLEDAEADASLGRGEAGEP